MLRPSMNFNHSLFVLMFYSLVNPVTRRFAPKMFCSLVVFLGGGGVVVVVVVVGGDGG